MTDTDPYCDFCGKRYARWSRDGGATWFCNGVCWAKSLRFWSKPGRKETWPYRNPHK